jgi:hypothetical protein
VSHAGAAFTTHPEDETPERGRLERTKASKSSHTRAALVFGGGLANSTHSSPSSACESLMNTLGTLPA